MGLLRICIFAEERAGNKMAARIAIIAIVTSNSVNVNPEQPPGAQRSPSANLVLRQIRLPRVHVSIIPVSVATHGTHRFFQAHALPSTVQNHLFHLPLFHVFVEEWAGGRLSFSRPEYYTPLRNF